MFHRKYTRGPLRGFYAATTLSGNQAVAVYDENATHVVSIADVPLAVPLPEGARNVTLSVLDRRDRTTPVDGLEMLDGEALFDARRCIGETKCYRLDYTL